MLPATTSQRAPAWLARLPGSALVLVAANLVPLIGVLFLGWNLALILVLYWVESGVVGLLNIPKILLARGPIEIGSRGVTFGLPFALDGQAGMIVRGLLAAFFVVHYGIFWAVHGVFVFLLPTLQSFGEPSLLVNGPGPAPWGDVEGGAIVGAAALLLASHGISFLVNYVGRREYLRVSPVQQMFAPYSRVMVMHLTILFGAFLAFMIGSPVWTIVVMVLVKTVIDLRLHAREHSGAASTVAVAPSQSVTH
jgi:Family of unknown function (DUF6498)